MAIGGRVAGNVPLIAGGGLVYGTQVAPPLSSMVRHWADVHVCTRVCESALYTITRFTSRVLICVVILLYGTDSRQASRWGQLLASLRCYRQL